MFLASRSSHQLQTTPGTKKQQSQNFTVDVPRSEIHTNDLCNHIIAQRRGRPEWSHFYVSDKRQYFYCSIPKNACTSWKLTVLRLTGKDLTRLGSVRSVHVWRRTDKFLKRAVHYSSGARAKMLKSYYKFMFVREPLERLVSAFRDKCLYDPYYQWLPRVIRKRRSKGNSTRTGMTKNRQIPPAFKTPARGLSPQPAYMGSVSGKLTNNKNSSHFPLCKGTKTFTYL